MPCDIPEVERQQIKAYTSLLCFICDHGIATFLPLSGWDAYGRTCAFDAVSVWSREHGADCYAESRGQFNWKGASYRIELKSIPERDETGVPLCERFAFQLNAYSGGAVQPIESLQWGWEERTKESSAKVLEDITKAFKRLLSPMPVEMAAA